MRSGCTKRKNLCLTLRLAEHFTVFQDSLALMNLCFGNPCGLFHLADVHAILLFLQYDISIVLREKGDFGRWTVDLFWKGDLVGDYEAEGSIPLPPYIRRMPVADDSDRYQTVYAREDKIGSVAAPTAGLHFTKEQMQELKDMGVNLGFVTLHVGLGTFRPVSTEKIEEHEMHKEYYSISDETAELIKRTKASGHRVIAVGTTSIRTLE